MSYIKADNPKEQKHFDYLEKLRKSGVTNMFGAAPYLKRAYGHDFSGNKTPTADQVLVKWMHLHSDPSRRVQGPNGGGE